MKAMPAQTPSGEYLRRRRIDVKVPLQAVADATGYVSEYLAQVELGEHPVTLEIAAAYLRALEVLGNGE